jgi:MFS family permease
MTDPHTDPVTADEVTNVEKIRRLPWSIATNSANSTFIQLTVSGSIFVLFLNELGLGKGETGLLLSLLPFGGVLALFAAPYVAHFGYKRTFLTFFSARTATASALLLTPWVLSNFGHHSALWYVTVVIALFCILRSIGMTAYFPWSKEFVPDAIRGKYTAIDSTSSAIVNFVAILGAKFVLERMTGLSGFMVLMAIGVGFAVGGIITGARIPGGSRTAPQPVVPETGEATRTTPGFMAWSDLHKALSDRDFRLYLAGLGTDMLAISPMIAFLPLFMQEEVGLGAGNVVLLQGGTLIGGVLTSYLWGWLADRFGSKPIVLAGLTLTLLLPVAWLLMPRHHSWSLPLALGISAIMGMANLGRGTGNNRLLYVNILPPAHKMEYMAIYYAWSGLFGGLAQILAGWLLSRTQGLRGQWGPVHIDPYTPLFIIGFILPLVGFFLFNAIRTNDAVTPGKFVKLLTHGNPFLAMEGLIGFHLAKDEETAVVMTQRLGQADSPLVTDELIEALGDPRFWVRFEALLAMANMQPNEQVRAAVVEVLNSGDPVLSVVAAWALGRMRDVGAVGPLRRGLEAPNRAVQEYSARSLGILGDYTVVPVLLQRLVQEDDPNLQLAYASALGQLRVNDAIPELLRLLHTSESSVQRTEVALALARIVGREHEFIQLLRQANQDAATATAQALLNLKRKVGTWPECDEDVLNAVEECADTLGREQMAEGVTLMCCLVEKLPRAYLGAHCCAILEHCVERLGHFGCERLEYLVLALHTLNGEIQLQQ